MTQRTTVVCAVCQTPVDVAIADPGLQPAAPADFDTRPAEPLRSSIASWVQYCPKCGYCAEDIGAAAEGAAEIVDSPAYLSLVGDTSLPPLTRSFLCFSVLLERLHQHADAGWSALHAAWVCDDERAEQSAVSCRARAITHWQTAKGSGQQFADDMATEFALATDLYRRMGEFEQATVACAEGLDLEDIPPIIERLLRRQLVLIQRRDTAAHSMQELSGQSGRNAEA